MEPKIYREPSYTGMPHKHLSEKAYGEALETFVVVFADVVFVDSINPKTFLLARRRVKPMQGQPWFVGGRISAGEVASDAICRITKRETSLELPPERFRFLAMNRYFFKDRQQEPQNCGSDSLGYVFMAELTPAERETASQNLDPDEYDTPFGLQAFDETSLKNANGHPAIIDLYAYCA